jgi:hypothetical protein
MMATSTHLSLSLAFSKQARNALAVYLVPKKPCLFCFWCSLARMGNRWAILLNLQMMMWCVWWAWQHVHTCSIWCCALHKHGERIDDDMKAMKKKKVTFIFDILLFMILFFIFDFLCF